MKPKLTKNEIKVYNIIRDKKKISQPDLVDAFTGEYKNLKSKRVCISIALQGLKAKGLIMIDSREIEKSGIPTNIWTTKKEVEVGVVA